MARIKPAKEPFLKKMAELKGAIVQSKRLTMEEAEQIIPENADADLDKDGNEIPKKKSLSQANREAKEARKAAKAKAFVPPRFVTHEGFPVSKAGWEKCCEIGRAVEDRDPEMHDM